MQKSLPLAALSLFSLAMLACSSTPPAEQPTGTLSSEAEADPNASTDSTPAETQAEDPGSTPAPSGTVKKTDDANIIPDDYTMMEGDCSLLGKKLGDVVRSDHMAQLSPKLSEDKRTAAEQNIDSVATKLSTQWINGCQSSLVGKVVERARLKCALESRSMKAFEECINPPAPK